ncbi:RNA polymerase III transcription factor (TF)IIIC subunit [Moesziomyces antarcticus T-34]|uniref:RNA polymerase III transcription factor (TF)IIIC subunit n=1 Tax=Pseudozyma antarctica (strain T-34) TaxID=1151754 RepID=M9LY23_PSEA3|nr:RNA polymerase III transcription factor (TF)IIIC subunit [Moesziomyces antarcticus T-34]
MSHSSAAKGKARALDSELASQPATPAESITKRTIQPRAIPATTLLSVEYPGILSDDAAAGPSSASLERALSTLHPSTLPPLTSSAHEGLRFLAHIPNDGLRVVECRLGGFEGGVDNVYRSPLIGEVVPTSNVVVRIVRRTWRQKRKRPPSPPLHTLDSALDPALFVEPAPPAAQQMHENGDAADRYTGRVKKEYAVQALGMASNTVRFRSMADYAFQPAITTTPTSTSNGARAEPELDAVMSMHKALATMDLAAFERFRVPPQDEDYQTRDGPSKLGMLPPAFFSRMDVPFSYGFSQTPYSELRSVPATPHLAAPAGGRSFAHALAGEPGMQRFVNRVRLNIAPQPFRVGKDTKVPTKPVADVVRIEHRCDASVVARLRELLAERPVWSRVALKSQLDANGVREMGGNNEKVYYALVGYSMVGGPWRDTIVRFGYDVRSDCSSRIYQRVFLRSTVHRPSTAAAEEEEDDEAPSMGAVGLGDKLGSTHVFDGVTPRRGVGNFQLCDIEDPLITPYIWRRNDDELPQDSVLPLERMGTPWLRDTFDPETGWYTRRALELIRAIIAARFKALIDTQTPLDPAALDTVVARIRTRWHEEDAQSHPSEPAHT